MKLYFVCSAVSLCGREPEVKARIAERIPEARVQYDTSLGALCVFVSDTEDRERAEREVLSVLADLGIAATPLSECEIVRPVEIKKIKSPKTVRLSVFIIALIATLLIASLLSFFLSSVFLNAGKTPLGNDSTVSEDNLGKIKLVDYIFSKYSTYDINGNLQVDSMLRAYVTATGDRYAAYYNAEEYAELVREESGQSAGIGVRVAVDGDNKEITVTYVMKNSPAELAGVRAGDRIIAVGAGEEKTSVADIGANEAVARLRGEIGTTAEFSVMRGDDEIPFSILRAEFTAITVIGRVSEANAAVGIVEITEFGVNTPAQFKSEMQKLMNAGCDRFIFDLRDNPGGELRSITAVLSYFMNENDTIVSTVTADGETTTYKANPVTYRDIYAPCSVDKTEIGMYRAFPKVTLTNENTASAAELFTAALRDYDLSTQVGKTTFGKGVFQNVVPLESWGYSGALRLTVGKYNPPSGENFDGVGVIPAEGCVVELPEGANFHALDEAQDAQLQKAIQVILTK